MRLLWLKLLLWGKLLTTTTFADQFRREWPKRKLSWWQRHYYQQQWFHRLRFTTTPRPGATPEWHERRLVYPCYCYKPRLDDPDITEYERRAIESDHIFILNK